jgi:hypothetical protein
MSHLSKAGNRRSRPFATFIAAGACCLVAALGAGPASAAGLHASATATHGDCKNQNAAKHNGYDCPLSDSGGTAATGTSGDTILVF